MSDDIIVYDKMTTNFANFGLAVLENAYKPRVYQRLNSDYVADFYLPQTDEKRQYLEQENIVKIDGQLFFIRGVTDALDEHGVLSVFVECEHVFYELYTLFIPSIAQTNVSPSLMLDAVLSGTRFTGDATALSGQHQFTVDKENGIWGINHFLALTDAEMFRDNFAITMKTQIGSNNGVSFREGKNIRAISRKVDSSGVTTRLYVFGKDDLTIDPIDSQYINNYPTVKAGKVVFSDVTDAATLQAKGEEYLAQVEVPKYTYQVKVVELKAAIGYGPEETVSLGDTVSIYVDSLDINVTARIVEYEEFPKNPEESNVTFANFIPGIEDTLTLLNDTRETVDTFTTGRKLNTFFLDGEIDTLRNFIKASGAYASATVLDNGGLLLENTEQTSPDFGALYLGPGIFAIANTKDASGNWQWTNFGTGAGFTADKINAGQIQTALVKIFGDVNFYWDDTNIYIIDPADNQKQMRIGKYDGTNYGIGFTTDGGATWKNALDFNGLVIGPDTTFDAGYDPTTKETPTGAQAKADAAQAAATAVANDAQTAADAAQTDATTANNLLADIASDSKLTPVEKQKALGEWGTIADEKATIDAQADAYAITTEKTAYDTSFQALADYLNNGVAWTTGTPATLADLSTTTDIVGTTFRDKFKGYFDAKTALLKKVTDLAKQKADAAQAAADAAQATADGKIETFYQTTMPTTGSVGDLWLDTDDGNKLYRHDGSTFVAVQDAAIQTALSIAQNAQTTADGKITSYFQAGAPTGASEGDFWIDTDDKNKIYRYTSGSWTLSRDTDIAQAISDAASASSTASSAQSTANTAQSTANAAQATANNSVQQDTLYNGIKINPTDGFKAQRTDNKIRAFYNATNGILIQRSTDGGVTWIDQFTVDTDGIINASGIKIINGTIEITHSNGSKTVIDGASFRAYPNANDATSYIAVDGIGLYRNYNGTITRFRDAMAVGNATIPNDAAHGAQFGYTPSDPGNNQPNMHIDIDLIGGEWVGKENNLQLMSSVLSYSGKPTSGGVPIDANAVAYARNFTIQSVTVITGGLRVRLLGGVTWLANGDLYDAETSFNYMIIG